MEPDTRDWLVERTLQDASAFFVTNPLGSPELKLDERFALRQLKGYSLDVNSWTHVDIRPKQCHA
jgi:hypothetical protein